MSAREAILAKARRALTDVPDVEPVSSPPQAAIRSSEAARWSARTESDIAPRLSGRRPTVSRRRRAEHFDGQARERMPPDWTPVRDVQGPAHAQVVG